MKRTLMFSILLLFSLLWNGCSTPDTSYYLNPEETYVSSTMRLELTQVQVEEHKVIFELEYIKYKDALPDLDVTGITFTFQNIGYDYMQLSEYSHQELYTVYINGNIENLYSYEFNTDEAYTIVFTIDFSYFLAHYDPNGITSGIDTTSVVLYIDVAAVHMRLRSQ